ncbi:hypothetical protein WJX81_000932 [Elliptochloris bilobata]|uniref:BZIP domain-containing protein n=1 Tax=Elliptochloris bilobata TaxID=381761 RepID=A0AAW1QLS9_9CHLO
MHAYATCEVPLLPAEQAMLASYLVPQPAPPGLQAGRAAEQPGLGAAQAGEQQQERESVHRMQQQGSQRLLRPRLRTSYELPPMLPSSEDSDVDYQPPRASPVRRARVSRTRAKNRQKAKQVAVSDELEGMRDRIEALEATRTRQEAEIELLEQRLLLATSALLPPELA